MPTPPTFLDLYHKRLDWAVTAHEQFRAGLHPALRGQMATGSDSASAALYGPTQVGKTSVLMRLLGLDHERLDDIASVLRGGQPLGKSATAVPCTYFLADGQRWVIKAPGRREQRCSDTEAREVLRDIRAGVVTGQVTGLQSLRVGIPSTLRGALDSAPLAQIYDLPGTGARSRTERAYVDLVCRRYLEAADLILLVTRAEDLGVLAPANLDLEPLKDWVHAPERYRVVATYAFQPETMREFLVSRPNVGLDDVRRDIAAQMRTFPGLPEEITLARIIIPIDTGDSWTALMSKRPDLLDACERLNGESLTELTATLEESATVEHRIRADAHMLTLAQRLRTTRLGTLTAEIAAAKNDEKQKRQSLKEDRQRVADADHEHTTASKRVAVLTADHLRPNRIELPTLRLKGVDRTDRSEVHGALVTVEKGLEEAAERVWAEWLKQVRAANGVPLRPKPRIDVEVRKVIALAFRETRTRIDKPFPYLFGLGNAYDSKDVYIQLERDLDAAHSDVLHVIQKSAGRALGRLVKVAMAEERDAQRRRDSAALTLSKHEQDFNAAIERRRSSQAERSQTARDMKQTIARITEFTSLMERTYDEHRRSLLTQIGTEVDPQTRNDLCLKVLVMARTADRMEMRHGQ